VSLDLSLNDYEINFKGHVTGEIDGYEFTARSCYNKLSYRLSLNQGVVPQASRLLLSEAVVTDS